MFREKQYNIPYRETLNSIQDTLHRGSTKAKCVFDILLLMLKLQPARIKGVSTYVQESKTKVIY